MNSTTKIIGGFLTGAMLGVAAGLLLAPETGQRTRKKILDKSRELTKELTDEVAKTVTKGLDTVKSTYNQKVDQFANAGKSTIDTTKERIKAPSGV